MWKVFDRRLPGQSSCAWDEQWDNCDIQDGILFASSNTYMKPIFDRYFKPGLKILEGGCGPAYYVKCYKERGCDIVGVDFSRRIIERVKSIYPDLPIEVGDVKDLKFEDDFFDVYYSGGVVEHFEEGPFRALKEAHRVLKRDGILIVTIPYLNFLRRSDNLISTIKLFVRKTKVRKENHTGNIYKVTKRFEKDNSDLNFSSCVFTNREFKKILTQSGFEIIFCHGCSVAWGMRTFKIIDNLFNSRNTKIFNENMSNTKNMIKVSSCIKHHKNLIKKLAKDILIRERRDKWYLWPFVAILQYLFGNLAVFVCRAKKV